MDNGSPYGVFNGRISIILSVERVHQCLLQLLTFLKMPIKKALKELYAETPEN